jgi:Family of unknown function (DUF5681)
MADNAAGNQRGRPFQKGQSGNPSGKPPETRARVTVLGEKIMRDDADAIVQSVVEAAKNGDPTAMRLCVERLIPVRKGRPIEFELPQVETASGVVEAIGMIAKQMAEGELSPEEAATVASVIEIQRRAIDLADIEERLKKVEPDNDEGIEQVEANRWDDEQIHRGNIRCMIA